MDRLSSYAHVRRTDQDGAINLHITDVVTLRMQQQITGAPSHTCVDRFRLFR